MFLGLSIVSAQTALDSQSRPLHVQPDATLAGKSDIVNATIQKESARIKSLVGPITKRTVAEIAPGLSDRIKQASPSADLYKLALSEIAGRMKGSGNLPN